MQALTRCADDTAEATGEDRCATGIAAAQVFAQQNRDRKIAGLEALKDRTIVPRLLAKLVESGKVVKSGVNKATEYRLPN
jgi:hypothetical protein